MIKEEAVEEIGQIIDTIDNLMAALSIPMPADLHLKGVKASLPEVKDRLKQVYFGSGGDDVWSL